MRWNRVGRPVWMTLLGLATAAALVLSALPATAVTSTPPLRAEEINRTDWSFNGGEVSGLEWVWMESTKYEDLAEFRFEEFRPDLLSYDKHLWVHLTPLITNISKGGAGWGARVLMTLTYRYSGGSKSWNYKITLTNPFPFRSSLNSGGLGYQAYGSKMLTQSQFSKGKGSLTLLLRRDKTYTASGFHPVIAWNAESVRLCFLSL